MTLLLRSAQDQAPLVPGGGFAKCVEVPKSPIGCNANSVNAPPPSTAPASPALYVAVSFEPVSTTEDQGQQQGRGYAFYKPVARSISVTLHTVTESQKGASFNPTP